MLQHFFHSIHRSSLPIDPAKWELYNPAPLNDLEFLRGHFTISTNFHPSSRIYQLALWHLKNTCLRALTNTPSNTPSNSGEYLIAQRLMVEWSTLCHVLMLILQFLDSSMDMAGTRGWTIQIPRKNHATLPLMLSFVTQPYKGLLCFENTIRFKIKVTGNKIMTITRGA